MGGGSILAASYVCKFILFSSSANPGKGLCSLVRILKPKCQSGVCIRRNILSSELSRLFWVYLGFDCEDCCGVIGRVREHVPIGLASP